MNTKHRSTSDTHNESVLWRVLHTILCLYDMHSWEPADANGDRPCRYCGTVKRSNGRLNRPGVEHIEPRTHHHDHTH